MNPRTRNILLVVGSLLVIGSSAGWIYYREFKAPQHDVRLHQRVGEVMAEQTAKAVGSRGLLVLITIPTGPEPELKTQLEAFRRTLKKLGDYEIKTHELDTKDQAKYGLGSGLSGRRFLRTVKNNPTAAGIVSFVGAPKLSESEVADLTKMPKFIAETKSPDHLPKLFEKHIIQVAVSSRFVFPAPGPQKPKTPEQWFEKRYQIVAANDVQSIPAGEQP